MMKHACYVIKKNPGSTSNPWLMQMAQSYGGKLCYGSLKDLIFRPGIASLKIFHTAEDAKECISEDLKKPSDKQMCYSDSLVCKFEVFSDSVSIAVVEA